MTSTKIANASHLIICRFQLPPVNKGEVISLHRVRSQVKNLIRSNEFSDGLSPILEVNADTLSLVRLGTHGQRKKWFLYFR